MLPKGLRMKKQSDYLPSDSILDFPCSLTFRDYDLSDLGLRPYPDEREVENAPISSVERDDTAGTREQ